MRLAGDAPSIGRSGGQAMAEFVVMVSGALMILFMLVPVVAKLTDMSFSAQQLARYVAWERTVWFDYDKAPGETDEGDVATRATPQLLQSAEKRLLTFGSKIEAFEAQDIDAISAGSGVNAFWHWTHSADNAAMYAVGEMPAQSTLLAKATPSVAYEVLDVYNDGMSAVVGVLDTLQIAGDSDFLQIAHPTHNYNHASVNIPVSLAPGAIRGQPLFGKLTQLNVGAQAAVLADGWNAQGDHHMRERADDFAVGTMLAGGIVDAVIEVIGIFEPSFKDVEFDYVGIEPITDAPVKCTMSSGFCYFDE